MAFLFLSMIQKLIMVLYAKWIREESTTYLYLLNIFFTKHNSEKKLQLSTELMVTNKIPSLCTQPDCMKLIFCYGEEFITDLIISTDLVHYSRRALSTLYSAWETIILSFNQNSLIAYFFKNEMNVHLDKIICNCETALLHWSY